MGRRIKRMGELLSSLMDSANEGACWSVHLDGGWGFLMMIGKERVSESKLRCIVELVFVRCPGGRLARPSLLCISVAFPVFEFARVVQVFFILMIFSSSCHSIFS